MIYYMFMRLFYTAYILGALFLILKAISAVVFSPDSKWEELKKLPSKVLLALIWPLTLVTEVGRKRINKHLNK